LPKNDTTFRTVRLSPQRLAIVDSLRAARRKPAIHFLGAIDVTHARQALRDYEARTGQRRSFTALLIHCLARTIDEDKTIQAYRQGNHLVIFDDVDVCVLVEHEVGADRIAAPHVLRAANRKSPAQLHEEIRAAQKSGAAAAESWRYIRFYPWFPGFVRRLFWRFLYSRPALMKKTAGTVCVTAPGLFGSGGDWGLPVSGYTLTVTVGGIAGKEEIIDGQRVRREELSLTISVDHEIVDGAMLARFAERFRRRIERLTPDLESV